MPYLANLHDICGGVLPSVICLTVVFLLLFLGVWTVLAIARRHRGAGAASAVVFWVVLFPAAVPGIVFSGASIACSLSDGGPPSAGVAAETTLPPAARRG